MVDSSPRSLCEPCAFSNFFFLFNEVYLFPLCCSLASMIIVTGVQQDACASVVGFPEFFEHHCAECTAGGLRHQAD